MIILFEGPDGAGKTTAIREYFPDFEYHHFGVYKTPELAFKAYDDFLLECVPDEEQVIIDRLHISERIYGKIMRNKWMSPDTYSNLEMQLRDCKVVVVCCLPPLQVVLNNWKARQKDEYVQDNSKLTRIWTEYTRIKQHTCLPVVKFDYTDGKRDLCTRVQEARKNAYGA